MKVMKLMRLKKEEINRQEEKIDTKGDAIEKANIEFTEETTTEDVKDGTVEEDDITTFYN